MTGEISHAHCAVLGKVVKHVEPVGWACQLAGWRLPVALAKLTAGCVNSRGPCAKQQIWLHGCTLIGSNDGLLDLGTYVTFAALLYPRGRGTYVP